jgi:hypothetical protein
MLHVRPGAKTTYIIYESTKSDETRVHEYITDQHGQTLNGRILTMQEYEQIIGKEEPQNKVVEHLSAQEHERWSGWMEYQFSKGQLNPDGTWTMPAPLVERWTRQMNTPYHQLTEQEKESDREEARKTLRLLSTMSAN